MTRRPPPGLWLLRWLQQAQLQMFVVRWQRLMRPCRKLLLPGEPVHLPLVLLLVCDQSNLTVVLHYPAGSAVLRQ